jgi:hypothetical protein
MYPLISLFKNVAKEGNRAHTDVKGPGGSLTTIDLLGGEFRFVPVGTFNLDIKGSGDFIIWNAAWLVELNGVPVKTRYPLYASLCPIPPSAPVICSCHLVKVSMAPCLSSSGCHGSSHYIV